MKTAISIPDATFARVEASAARLGVSRSEFFARAAERWIADLEDTQTTAAIDAVLGDDEQDIAFVTQAASINRAVQRLVIARGEVWWAYLGTPHGSMPASRRPVLVISDDRYNNSRLRTVTVVVLTSTARLAALPGNVAIAAELSGLDKVLGCQRHAGRHR